MMNRQSNITTSQYDWSKLASEISTTLQTIYITLSQAFSEGNPKLEGAAVHQTQVFCEIWGLLNEGSLKATSLEALHKVYHPIEQNVDDFIKDYCRDASISEDIFPLNKRSVLIEAIRIHYALTKQQFLLSNFKPIDTPEEIAKRIGNAQRENKIIGEKISRVAFDKTEKNINLLYALTHKIFSTLISKYPNTNELNFVLDKNGLPELIVTQEENEALSKLQALLLSDDINEMTKHLREAVQQSHKKDIVKYQKNLTDSIQAVDDVQEALKKIVSEKIYDLINALKNATEEYDKIEANFSVIGQKSLAEIFQNILRMNGFTLNANTAQVTETKGYGELNELAFNFVLVCQKQLSLTIKKNDGVWFNWMWKDNEVKNSSWTAAAEKINELLLAEAIAIEKFLRPYTNLYNQTRMMKTQISSTSDKLNSFDSRRTSLASKLAKAEHIWIECDKIFDMVKAIMLNHIKVIPETDTEYLRSFLARHWGKIGLGSATGSLSVFLYAFLAAPWLVIPLSILAGGGAGILSGIGVDRFSKKPEEDHLSNERKPLLDKNPSQEDSHIHAKKDDLNELLPSPKQEEKNVKDIVIPLSLVYQSPKESNSNWWPGWTYGTFWSSSQPSKVPSESLTEQKTKRFSKVN